MSKQPQDQPEKKFPMYRYRTKEKVTPEDLTDRVYRFYRSVIPTCTAARLFSNMKDGRNIEKHNQQLETNEYPPILGAGEAVKGLPCAFILFASTYSLSLLHRHIFKIILYIFSNEIYFECMYTGTIDVGRILIR